MFAHGEKGMKGTFNGKGLQGPDSMGKKSSAKIKSEKETCTNNFFLNFFVVTF